MLAITMIPQPGSAQTKSIPSPIPLNFGFLTTIFTDLNERDAKAAIKVWGRKIIEKYNYDYKVSSFFYSDINTLTEAMINGTVNITPIPPIDYIKLNKTLTLYPAICAEINGSVLGHFILLARKDSHFNGIQDLANKTLLLKQEPNQSVQDIWLNVMLYQAGLPPSEVFFGEIIKKESEFQLIFPLLLKKADCCIMTQSAFKTMNELNPQLKVQLAPLLTSDSLLVSNIFVYTEQLNKETRNNVTSLAMNWGGSKSADQLQTIFRFNKLISYKTEYLKNVTLLLDKYNRFKKIK